MLFNDTYLTIAQKSEGLFKDRGSKFISYVFPVQNESEIKVFISELKKEHYAAVHHCYAYRIGADKQNYRMNDDGEPSGTAGKPIFGQIQSNDLTDILIVVVRYFGGTLLGTGGLIQAYRSAAAAAIQNNNIIKKNICYKYVLNFNFENMNDVMKLLKENNAMIYSQKFENTCEIEFSIRKSISENIEGKLKKLNSVKLNFITVE